ncbi:MAG: c-type cytochrome [Chitinophagales bacterium]|nr:c-type cytochrome [Chitinophagales bacterium]
MITLFKKHILVLTGVLLSLMVSAQQATSTDSAISNNDTLIYIIIGSSAILLVAIYLLGRVYVSLVQMKMMKDAAKGVVILLLMFSSLWSTAQAPEAPAATHFISFDIAIGIFVLGIELLTLVWFALAIRKILNQLSPQPEVKTVEFHLPRLFDNLNASVAIEKEADILLNHNYDGIRELDNQLPPWWKYSFYISIVWSIFYLAYYHVGNGLSSKAEYEKEVQLAKLQVEEYNRTNALSVDENSVTLANDAGILEGADIFKTNCSACHGSAGEGNTVGPNLTDKYWLHGGSLSDVFKSVKYGWPSKGMKSWQADLSPVQIKNVVSYIYSLQGTNPPNAKEPQGDEYNANTAATNDSTATASK